MKINFRFWLWRINVKIQKLGQDEKIEYLANELVKTVKNSGREIEQPSISKGFGSIDITMHRIGTDKQSMSVQSINNGWEIKIKPTFGEI